MNKSEVLKQIKGVGIIPVVRATTADEAMRAIDAIREGGISVLEITMTVPGAVSVIEQVAARFGDDALVGAGTVLDAETAKACISAGAQFIVSPALNMDTIAYCREEDVAVMPGALTPTEVVHAWKAGAAALGVGADLVDVNAQSALITERAKQFIQIVHEARKEISHG